MTRIKVSLDENEYNLAKHEAKASGISIPEFVRRAVRDKLAIVRSRPWMRYAGMVETGDPRSSEMIDEVVYGDKD